MSQRKQLRFTASQIDKTLRFYYTKAFKQRIAQQQAVNRARHAQENQAHAA